MLRLIEQKDDPNRVDVICWVFEIKLQQLMHYIKKEQPFGRVIASKFLMLLSCSDFSNQYFDKLAFHV